MRKRKNFVPSDRKILMCFGGVSPLYTDGTTTSYGIFIPSMFTHGRDTCIWVDCGSGIGFVNKFFKRELGKSENKNPNMLQLLTHAHMDHVIGLPQHAPLLDGSISAIMGKKEHIEGLNTLFSGTHWPIELKVPMTTKKVTIPLMHIKTVVGGEFVRIDQFDLPHGNTQISGFMITAQPSGHQICVATDCELDTKEAVEMFAKQTRDCNVIILDMQYSEHDYEPGFGHNCPETIIETLRARTQAGGRSACIMLVHRDPAKSNSKDSSINPAERYGYDTWDEGQIIMRLSANEDKGNKINFRYDKEVEEL